MNLMKQPREIINRELGYDFIISEFGAFTDEYKKYKSLRGAKAVEYLHSLGFTADKSKWNYIHFR